jgi:hypothetical protein
MPHRVYEIVPSTGDLSKGVDPLDETLGKFRVKRHPGQRHCYVSLAAIVFESEEYRLGFKEF